MPIPRSTRTVAAATLLLVACLSLQSPGRAAPSTGREWKAAQKTLSRLGTKRQQTVAALFKLNQNLTTAEARLTALTQAAQQDQKAAKASEVALSAATARFGAVQSQTEHLLRLVEYMGPTSYVGVLLGSQTFDDFSRRFGAVTSTLSAVQKQLAALKAAHDTELHAAAAAKQTAARAAAAKAVEARQIKSLKALKAKDSAAIAALGSQRAQVLSQLSLLKQSWVQKVHPYLQSIRKAVASLPQTVNNIPGTTVSLGLSGATITIPQWGLNDVFQKMPALSDLAFSLTPQGATLNIPSQNLTMQGTFEAKSGDLLVFHVTSASFSGIALDPSLVSAALGASGIAMNLSGALQGATLTSVATGSQEITLTAGLSF